MKKYIKTEELKVIFILFFIFLFANYYAIFHVDFLLHDDPGMFYREQNNLFKIGYMQSGVFVYLYHWKFPSWLTVYNIYLARIFILITMTLTAYTFFLLINIFLKVPKKLALIIVIFPNIYPDIIWIPSGINASYPPRFLFIYLLSLFFLLKYVEKNEKSVSTLIIGLFIYILFSQIDISIFTLPFSLLIIYYIGGHKLKTLYVSFSILLIALYKLLDMLLINRVQSILQSISTIIERTLNFFQETSPLYFIPNKFAFILFILLVLLSLILFAKSVGKPKIKNLFSLQKNNFNIIVSYLLFTTWMISNIIIFIIFKENENSRYQYISAYGTAAISFISLYIVVNYFLNKYDKMKYINFFSIIVILFIFITAILKNIYVREYFMEANNNFQIIKNNLDDIVYPNGSQIVIAGWKSEPFFGQGWERSSGQLRHILKLKDISGQLVLDNKMYHFKSHFNNIRKYPKKYYSSGLNEKKPLFMYIVDSDKKFKQLSYILEFNKNKNWTIYKVDKKSGEILILSEGKGKNTYLKYIEKNNLIQNDILWGQDFSLFSLSIENIDMFIKFKVSSKLQNIKVAFYLYKDNKRVDTQWYGKSLSYKIDKKKYGKGKYRIRYFIADKNKSNPSKEKILEEGYSKYIEIQ